MGHVWLEPNGAVFVRHNAREREMIKLHCKHCTATSELPAFGKETAPITGQDEMSAN